MVRKIAAILVSDVVGYSRLVGADEDRILSRLRTLRSDLIDPTIAVHNGQVVKRTGDGSLVEFRSIVDAVRCAIEVQDAMVERNAGVLADRRIEFRIGIHLGDVGEEADGDLMGDSVNIAARLEGIATPGAICLSEDAYRQLASGSRGDVQPAIALAAALAARRHATRLVAPANFATLTAGRGVVFRPLPFDLIKEMHEPETKQFFLSNGNPIALLRWLEKAGRKTIHAFAPVAMEGSRGADLIVGAGLMEPLGAACSLDC